MLIAFLKKTETIRSILKRLKVKSLMLRTLLNSYGVIYTIMKRIGNSKENQKVDYKEVLSISF